MKKLSVVIPAYNEESSIGELLEKIQKVQTIQYGHHLEIIVIDDCSSDQTGKIAKQFKDVIYLKQDKNRGKGAAVKRGISVSTGDLVLVQDADLEYEPQDYLKMLDALDQKTSSQVSIYGSRSLGQIEIQKETKNLFKSKHPEQKYLNWLAGKFLTLFTYLLYRVWITDTLTAYKMYPGDLVRNYHIITNGFETDHELTAFLVRNGVQIVEVPIHYYPRSVEEGKKIKAIDFFIALRTLVEFRWS